MQRPRPRLTRRRVVAAHERTCVLQRHVDACACYVSVKQMHVHAFASRLTRRRVAAAHELELVAMTALLIASKHQELSPQGVQVSAAAFYS